PPAAVYPHAAASLLFPALDRPAEPPARPAHNNSDHFWFHRTDSLDYAVVLEGEITLLVDEGEATLSAGDVVVQRATSHAWSNRTDKTARMLFVLIGTPPQTAEDIAAQRKA